MNRFDTIEEARETFSYANEDLHEIRNFISNGKLELAYEMLNKMVYDVETAAKQFPEMEAELEQITAAIKPYVVIMATRGNKTRKNNGTQRTHKQGHGWKDNHKS